MTLKYLLAVFFSSLIVSFVLYGNTIKGEFVYDDSFFSGRGELHDVSYLGKIWSESLRPNEPKAEVYRPLTVFTFALNFILFGESPVSFHIVNIILNGIVVFLVFLVTYQLFKNKYLSLFTSLVFAFLPIHTETVANIKSRDDILSTLLVLVSTWVFLNAVEAYTAQSGKKIDFKLIGLTSVILFASFFAKEFAIVAPIFLLTLFFVLKSPKIGDLIKVGVYFSIPLGVYLFIRFSVLGRTAFGDDNPFWYYIPSYHYSLTERISTAFKILYLYIQKTFVPYNLSATHHFNHLNSITNPFSSPEALIGIILLTVFLVLVLHKKTRLIPLGIGSLMFLTNYFIFSKFVFKSGEILAERWMYLPSVGLCLILAYLIDLLFRYKKIIGISVLLTILVIYATLTFNRNKVWTSELALYESMIRDAPRSAQGYIGLSYYYIYKGDYRKTEYYMVKGIEIVPDNPRLLNISAAINIQKKKYKEAEEAVKRSIETLAMPATYILYAIILTDQGKYEESLAITKQYMDSPFYKDNRNYSLNTAVNYITAVNLKELGRWEEAELFFELTKPLGGVNPL